jgi:hypothetical protein
MCLPLRRPTTLTEPRKCNRGEEMRKQIIIVFLGLLLISTVAEGTNWVFISESEKGSTWYVDKESIKEISKNIVREWVKRIPKPPNPENLSYALTYSERNCKENKTNILQISDYYNDGTKKFYTYGKKNWYFVPLKSVDETIHKFVCLSISQDKKKGGK